MADVLLEDAPVTKRKSYLIINSETKECWLLDEYADATNQSPMTLRKKLNAAFAEDPRQNIRVPHDHPCFKADLKRSPTKARKLYVFTERAEFCTNPTATEWLYAVCLKSRTLTHQDGSVHPIAWEKGEFKGTRRPRKA